MHLIIRTDGRAERHDSRDPYDERRSAFRTLNVTSDFGGDFSEEKCLPIRMPVDPGKPTFTLWIGEPTITRDVGLRNIPASILAGQWGIPVRVLSGPVVVTCSGSVASAYIEDARWAYVESLVNDIVRALAGQPCSRHVVDPAWPSAVMLAGAILESSARPRAPHLSGDAAIDFLLSELGLPVLAEDGQ